MFHLHNQYLSSCTDWKCFIFSLIDPEASNGIGYNRGRKRGRHVARDDTRPVIIILTGFKETNLQASGETSAVE